MAAAHPWIMKTKGNSTRAHCIVTAEELFNTLGIGGIDLTTFTQSIVTLCRPRQWTMAMQGRLARQSLHSGLEHGPMYLLPRPGEGKEAPLTQPTLQTQWRSAGRTSEELLASHHTVAYSSAHMHEAKLTPCQVCVKHRTRRQCQT